MSATFTHEYGAMTVKDWTHEASIAAIVRATFPNYRRKTVRLHTTSSVTLQDLNWSGGTRSEYKACKLDGTLTGGSDRYHQIAPWENPAEGMTLPIPAGMIMVRGGHFCGKESQLSLYVNPADMPRYLPKPE